MGLFKKKEVRKAPQKASGGDKLYFIFHNLLSMVLFLVSLWRFDLYSKEYETFFAFLQYFGILVILTILFGFIARILVYIPLKIHYDNNNKALPSFGDINQGINELFTWPYFVRTLLSMELFAIWGKLFTGEPWESTVIAYLVLKGIINVYVYIKYK